MDINNVSTHQPTAFCLRLSTNETHDGDKIAYTACQTLNEHITVLKNHARLLADAANRFRSVHSAQSDELQTIALRAYQAVLDAHKARDILRGLGQEPQQKLGHTTEPVEPATPAPTPLEKQQASALVRKRASEDQPHVTMPGSAKRRRIIQDEPLTDIDVNVEYEDISEEVEARLQRQEQRRRETAGQAEKQGEKRKRGRVSTGTGRVSKRSRPAKSDLKRPQTYLNPHADMESDVVKQSRANIFKTDFRLTWFQKWDDYLEQLMRNPKDVDQDWIEREGLFALAQVGMWDWGRPPPSKELEAMGHVCKSRDCRQKLLMQTFDDG